MRKQQNNRIKPRWRKVFADLWENKLRTALVVASIAVGVFSVGTTVTTYVILSQDIEVTYARLQPANIDIQTDPFGEDFVRAVERLPGILDAEGRQFIRVRASQDGESWENVKLIGVADFSTMQVNLLTLLDGKLQPARREMIISQDFLNNTGFQVGDQIEIELSNGDIFQLPLVGVVADQITNGRSFVGNGANIFVTLDTLEWMGYPNTFNRLYVRVADFSDNETFIAQTAAQIESKLERNNLEVYRTRTQRATDHPFGDIVFALLGVLGALGGFILILSSSLIVNTLNALLTQHLRQIGVVKLIGGRSRQIIGMYLTLILLYGLAALGIAVPLSVIAGYALAEFITGFINADLLGFRVVPVSIVIQTFVALFIPLLAGFMPVNKGAKTNVRRAIRSEGNPTGGGQTGWFDRFSQTFQWISRPVILSLRNTFRRKSRLALTIFTLTAAGAIFIGVFNVRASLDHFMAQTAQHFKADVTLGFNRPYPISRIEQVVMQVPGVVALEGWAAANVDILDADDAVVRTINIMAPPADSTLVDPDMIAGRWVFPGEQDALVLSDAIYDEYPLLQPGDTLPIDTPKGRTENWTVVGIFRFSSIHEDILGYADFDFISDQIDMSNQAMNFRIITAVHSYSEQKRIGNILDSYLRAHDFMVNEVEAGSITQSDSAKALDVLVIFLLLMALLTALVGSIGLTGTMGMNVMERTREIGVMRAIGAIDHEIIKSVVIEGGLIGGITWFFAIFLSFPISHFLLKIITQAIFGSPIRLVITYQGFAIWLATVIVLSVVASLIPARNAAKLTIREVLAYE